MSRWPFLAAVALVSAAVSDVMVEALANAGAFGAGFSDTDDAGIVPCLCVALLLAGSVLALHVRALYRHTPDARRQWFAAAARQIAARPPLRDFPAVAGMQFAALFAMESVESFVASGHAAPGLLWLGGPAAVSIAAHLTIGALCTLVARWFMRVSVAGLASLVCIALQFVRARDTRGGAACIARRVAASCRYAQTACVRCISGRAPPFVTLPASSHSS